MVTLEPPNILRCIQICIHTKLGIVDSEVYAYIHVIYTTIEKYVQTYVLKFLLSIYALLILKHLYNTHIHLIKTKFKSEENDD